MRKILNQAQETISKNNLDLVREHLKRCESEGIRLEKYGIIGIKVVQDGKPKTNFPEIENYDEAETVEFAVIPKYEGGMRPFHLGEDTGVPELNALQKKLVPEGLHPRIIEFKYNAGNIEFGSIRIEESVGSFVSAKTFDIKDSELFERMVRINKASANKMKVSGNTISSNLESIELKQVITIRLYPSQNDAKFRHTKTTSPDYMRD